MVAKNPNLLELQIQISNVLKQLKPIEKERNKLIDNYRKLYFKIFDNCDHFIVPSYDNSDEYSEHQYCSYGCIKCGLNLMALSSDGPDYDFEYDVMKKYFESGKKLRSSYKPKVKFRFDGWSTYGSFEIGKKLCKKVLKNNPLISNDELDQKLIEVVKDVKKNNKGRSRVRI